MEWINSNSGLISIIIQLLILGFLGWLAYMNKFFYQQSLKAKEDQIDVLKVTQVKNYVDNMNKFKELYETVLQERDNELESLKTEMDKLLQGNLSKDEIIESQKKLIDEYKDKIDEAAYKKWEGFLNIRIKEAIEVEKWEDVINIDELKGSIIPMWTLKYRDGKIESSKYKVLKKDDEK